MKIKYIMERAGIGETGRGISYIKDALEELNMLSETHVKTQRFDIKKNKRFYTFPSDMIQLKGVRCKNHLNSKGEQRDIPRLLYEPRVHDEDGV